MKKSKYKKIKIITWKIDKKEKSSTLNGFLVIKPSTKRYLDSIKRQIKLFEKDERFHKKVKKFRDSINLEKIKISKDEMRNRKLINKKIYDLDSTISGKINKFAVKLSKQYLNNDLPLNFSAYIVYDFFPLEESLLDLSFYKKEKGVGNPLLIEIHKNMGKNEFKKQMGELYDHIKEYISELEEKEFFKERGTFEIDEKIYDMAYGNNPKKHKEIARIFDFPEGTISQKLSRFKLKIKRLT